MTKSFGVGAVSLFVKEAQQPLEETDTERKVRVTPMTQTYLGGFDAHAKMGWGTAWAAGAGQNVDHGPSTALAHAHSLHVYIHKPRHLHELSSMC